MRQMDVAVGRTVYTPILLPAGGFKADLTIMRLGDDRFRVVTGGGWGMSDLKWFADHLPLDGSAQIADRTESISTLGLWGPRARDILQSVSSDDVSHEGLPFGRFKTIEIGLARSDRVADLLRRRPRLGAVRADRAGREAVGRDRAKPARHMARSPIGAGVYGTTGRLEKGYRAYGAELEGEYDVVEAGMAWGKVKDQEFIGKQAHVAQRESEPAAQMCTLTVDRPQLEDRRQALHARWRADRARRRIADRRRQGPSLVCDQRRLGAVDRQAHLLMAYLPPEHAERRKRAARPVHGRALSGQGRFDRRDVAV